MLGKGQRSRSRTLRLLYRPSLTASALCTALVLSGIAALGQSISWKDALRQKPGWYGSPEAVRIAENLLVYQHDNGGWEKNVDMAAPLDDKTKAAVIARKPEAHTTIDNSSTYTQAEFLARVYGRTKRESYRSGFDAGIDFLLSAQYPNGGWPQFFPLRQGYWSHITFNDDAMAGVLMVLREVARKRPPYEFVDEARRAAAERAVRKGIECILRCQIVVNGRRTAWCAQHDEVTLAPAPARAYEKVSLKGGVR